jgi:hypothetical protein
MKATLQRNTNRKSMAFGYSVSVAVCPVSVNISQFLMSSEYWEITTEKRMVFRQQHIDGWFSGPEELYWDRPFPLSCLK